MPALFSTRASSSRRASSSPRASRRSLSPPQSTFQLVSLWWRHQDGDTRAAWNRLGSRMAPPMSGRNAFLSVNLTRLSASLPLLQEPPSVPQSVPFLETPGLSATLAGGGLRVTLHYPGDPVLLPVQAYFAPPRVPSPGVVPHAKDFRLMGTLPNLAHGDTDITFLYGSSVPLLTKGYELWVRLLPLSPLGFRGAFAEARADVIAEQTTESRVQ